MDTGVTAIEPKALSDRARELSVAHDALHRAERYHVELLEKMQQAEQSLAVARTRVDVARAALIACARGSE